jgi:hypothetical protein
MITLTAAEEAAIASGQRRIGIFFQLATVSPLNLWFGIGDIVAGVWNGTSTVDALFKGKGEFTDIPTLQQLINGEAERATFSVSGVSDDTIALVGDAESQVPGAAVRLGIGLFGLDWQLLGDVHWLFKGTADYVSQSIKSVEGGFQNIISISVGTRWTGRRRPQNSFMTDGDQKRRSPGDRFCENTQRYSQEVKKAWPRF